MITLSKFESFLAASTLLCAVAFPQGADECANATALVGPGPHLIDGTNATHSGVSHGTGCNPFRDVWFQWTAPTTDQYAVDVAPTGPSSGPWVVVVLDGTAPCPGTFLACEEFTFNGNDHRVFFNAVANKTYILQVEPGFVMPTGSMTIEPVGPPPNDTCSLALPIGGDGTFAYDQGNPAVISTDNTACFSISNSVWFAWTAAQDGMAQLSVDGTYTHAAVYDACGGMEINCETNTVTWGTNLIFAADAGTTYLLRIGTYGGSAPEYGSFSIETRFPKVNPANGHAYLWVGGPLTWNNANQAAQSTIFNGVPGHLVTIADQAEADFIANEILIASPLMGHSFYSPFPWTGMFQDYQDANFTEPAGGWKWVTGEPITYTNWLPPNRPDNSLALGNPEDFMVLYGTQWEDWPNGVNSYVVEWDLNRQGTTFCDPAELNSTGHPTELHALATTANSTGIRFEVSRGPSGEFGYLLVGSGSADPGLAVDSGNLCLAIAPGQVIGRYNHSGTNRNSLGQFQSDGEFQNLSATSTTGTGFELPTTLPISGGPTITAGQTWHYQLWHRDGMGNSNFSNGVSLAF